jgi:hypothetical protein
MPLGLITTIRKPGAPSVVAGQDGGLCVSVVLDVVDDESKYKGAFIRAFTIGDIMKSLKKVLGGARWIGMCKKCEDEQS